MQPRQQGTLITWKAEKAFGFIRPDAGGNDVFIHLRDFGRLGRPPRVGDVVRFQKISDGRGRYRAGDVEVVGLPRASGQRVRAPHRASGSTEMRVDAWRWLVVAAFAGTLTVLTIATALPIVILPFYVVVSLVTLGLYAMDKSAAMNRMWRTSEATLLLAGLIGGWPGALIAQGLLRHKTRKLEFLTPYWMSVAANCAALAWACSESGAAAIRDLLY